MGISNIVGKCRSQWRGVECDLLDDDGIFIAKGLVIDCNPMGVILDDQLGEDHVRLCTTMGKILLRIGVQFPHKLLHFMQVEFFWDHNHFKYA